ncbi:hypothetical protein CEW46_21275 [Bacillus cereus]|nr:hypothetical protein CEW46_21275 [Bacillus cereus]
MKKSIKLGMVAVLSVSILGACSSEESKPADTKPKEEVVKKAPEPAKKVDDSAVKLQAKIKDTEEIINKAMELGLQQLPEYSSLNPETSIDPSGRVVTVRMDLNALANQMGIGNNLKLAKEGFSQGLTYESWGWIKGKSYQLYGKDAGFESEADIQVKFVNKNDGEVIKVL